MKINSKSLLLYFLLLLAGSALGFIVGGYGGAHFGMGLVTNNSINKDAHDLQTQLLALRALRRADTARAIEMLEASVDDQLIIFDPLEPYPGLDEDTRLKVRLAIESAWEYRHEFPRQSDRAHVDSMVEALFRKQGLVEK